VEAAAAEGREELFNSPMRAEMQIVFEYNPHEQRRNRTQRVECGE